MESNNTLNLECLGGGKAILKRVHFWWFMISEVTPKAPAYCRPLVARKHLQCKLQNHHHAMVDPLPHTELNSFLSKYFGRRWGMNSCWERRLVVIVASMIYSTSIWQMHCHTPGPNFAKIKTYFPILLEQNQIGDLNPLTTPKSLSP